MPENELVEVLGNSLNTPRCDGGNELNVVDGLFAIARSLDKVAMAIDGCGVDIKEAADDLGSAQAGIAKAIYQLGNADAATPMGGLEALGAVLEKAGDAIASSINGLAGEIATK